MAQDFVQGVYEYPGYPSAGAGFHAEKTSAGQAVASGYQYVTFQTEDDPQGWFDGTRFLPKAAGRYRVSYQLTLSGGTSGTVLDSYLVKNASAATNVTTTTGIAGTTAAIASNGWLTETVTTQVYMNGSTDYLEVVQWGAASGSGTIRHDSNLPTFFCGELISTTVGVAPEPWIAPSLLNGWANYTPADYANAGYMKDPHGFVHLRGHFTAAAAINVFNLPVGYRPAEKYHEFSVTFWNGTTMQAALAQVRGSSAPADAGMVRLYSNASGTPTAGHLYNINGLTFRAES